MNRLYYGVLYLIVGLACIELCYAELTVKNHLFNIHVNPIATNTVNNQGIYAPELNQLHSVKTNDSSLKYMLYSSRISPFSKTIIRLIGQEESSDEDIIPAVVGGEVLNDPNPFKL